MSLIQEALKRQQEEAERLASGGELIESPAARPPPKPEPLEEAPTESEEAGEEGAAQEEAPNQPPPPPLAAPTVSPAKRLSLSLSPVVAGIAVLILVAVVVIGGFLLLSKSRTTGEPSAAGVEPDDGQPDIAESEEPDTRPVTPTEAAAQPTPRVSGHEEDSPRETTPIPIVVRPKATPTKTPPPPPPPVPWPSLSLSGVVGGGHDGAAIINDEVVSVGDSILGVKVVSIVTDGVMLEFRGGKTKLRVGKSIP